MEKWILEAVSARRGNHGIDLCSTASKTSTLITDPKSPLNPFDKMSVQMDQVTRPMCIFQAVIHDEVSLMMNYKSKNLFSDSRPGLA